MPICNMLQDGSVLGCLFYSKVKHSLLVVIETKSKRSCFVYKLAQPTGDDQPVIRVDPNLSHIFCYYIIIIIIIII